MAGRLRRAPLAHSPAIGALLCLVLGTGPVCTQDLDPRAYAWAPVDATFLVAGFSLSHGGVVSDASLPYAWAQVSGDLVGEARAWWRIAVRVAGNWVAVIGC